LPGFIECFEQQCVRPVSRRWRCLNNDVYGMKPDRRGAEIFPHESFEAIAIDRACRAAARDCEAEAGEIEIVGAGDNGKLVAAVSFTGAEYLPEIGSGEQPHGFVERLLPAA